MYPTNVQQNLKHWLFLYCFIQNSSLHQPPGNSNCNKRRPEKCLSSLTPEKLSCHMWRSWNLPAKWGQSMAITPADIKPNTRNVKSLSAQEVIQVPRWSHPRPLSPSLASPNQKNYPAKPHNSEKHLILSY